MKVALIGITGRVGSRLLTELLSRGHTVVGIARHVPPGQLPAGVTVKTADATQTAALALALADNEAVISASRFASSDAVALIAAVRQAGAKRLLVVGGASSLEVAPGKILLDTPDFPEAYKAEGAGGLKFLEVLRKERDLDWTFLSPSADFAPGVRSGKFRIGKDQLLVDADGKSWISMEDFAIAMVDELEQPKHSRQRFTVGY